MWYGLFEHSVCQPAGWAEARLVAWYDAASAENETTATLLLISQVAEVAQTVIGARGVEQAPEPAVRLDAPIGARRH